MNKQLLLMMLLLFLPIKGIKLERVLMYLKKCQYIETKLNSLSVPRQNIEKFTQNS